MVSILNSIPWLVVLSISILTLINLQCKDKFYRKIYLIIVIGLFSSNILLIWQSDESTTKEKLIIVGLGFIMLALNIIRYCIKNFGYTFLFLDNSKSNEEETANALKSTESAMGKTKALNTNVFRLSSSSNISIIIGGKCNTSFYTAFE